MTHKENTRFVCAVLFCGIVYILFKVDPALAAAAFAMFFYAALSEISAAIHGDEDVPPTRTVESNAAGATWYGPPEGKPPTPPPAPPAPPDPSHDS